MVSKENAALLLSPLALSIQDLERAVELLPAENRATAQWLIGQVDSRLRSLLTETLTDELIDSVTAGVTPALMDVVSVLGSTAPAFMAIHAEATQTYVAQLEQLSPDSTFRQEVRAIIRVLSFRPEEFAQSAKLHSELIEAAKSFAADGHPAASGFRLGVLWLAICAALHGKCSEDRVFELVDIAFLETIRLEGILELGDDSLPPVIEEPLERQERILRNVAAARDVLDAEDLRIIDDARFRTLR
jgi:hypothetical protein